MGRMDRGGTAGWLLFNCHVVYVFLCFKEVSLLFFSAVIQALIHLLNMPELDSPLRPDLAKEFRQDREIFLLRAEDHTSNFSEKRPCE